MRFSRVLLVSVVTPIMGFGIGLAVPGSAAATALTDGLYRFDFDGSQQTLGGKPNATKPYSTLIAIRSACAAAGCVATATDTSIGPTWLQPPYEGAFVLREDRNQWAGTRWRMFTCNNTINQGTETLAFQVTATGTFAGASTGLEEPCAPIVTPFTATRVGDIPADVVVAEPSAA